MVAASPIMINRTPVFASLGITETCFIRIN
jgi:hypothetical protein